MGTSNFSRGNTSKVYAVLMNIEETFKECSECGHKHFDFEYSAEGFKNLTECENECEDAILTEETETRAVESYEVDEFKEYLRERAEEKSNNSTYIYSEEDSCGNERNYTSNELFSLRTSKMYGDIEVYIKITAQIVSAYYEGASLDYEVAIDNGGELCELSEYHKIGVDDILDDLFAPKYQHNYSDMSQGLRTILMNKAIKWAEKEVEKMKDLVEEIFTEVSQPLEVVATFSNGETIYK